MEVADSLHRLSKQVYETQNEKSSNRSKKIPQVSLRKVETQLEIKDSVNEIDSHITFAKEETIDTIKASEMKSVAI